MAGKIGGARPGAGRPKGSSNGITIAELRSQLTSTCGMPFEQMLALTAVKLFQDFQQNENIDSWVRFSNNLAKYVVQAPQQEIIIENTYDNLSEEELNQRIAQYVKTNG